MGKIIYAINISQDGCISDENGNFDWSEPKEDVHTYINEIERQNHISILGRKMYETLAVWETMKDMEKYPSYIQAYKKIWLGKQKIVFSHTMKNAITKNTIIKNELTKKEIEQLKNESPSNITIGGSNIASQALDMKLVDEIILFIYPVIVGKGKMWISNTRFVKTKLINTIVFENGIIMLHYLVLY